MLRLLIENYLLLEVAGVKLKDIKPYILDLTSTEIYSKLQTFWNKRYKKYGNFIKRVLADAGETKISEADLGRLVSILDKFESYINTSPLRSEIAKDWRKITLTLQDLVDYIEEQESKIIYTEKDKKSLQSILSLCGPLDKLEGRTFSCEHYDIVLCTEDILVVKPKTVKGSVAWALSDNNGQLERFGPNHIDPMHRITWCTSVYSADENTWNEFLTYYIGNLTTLFYVINRFDYKYGSEDRKICIGVDDIENEVIYDGSVTVDANNDPIESIDGIKDLYTSEEFEQISNAIFGNRSEISSKTNPLEMTKRNVKTLFDARNKSTAARAMLRRFLLTNGGATGNFEEFSYCIDLFLNSSLEGRKDYEFINDAVKGIFLSGQTGGEIIFDSVLKPFMEKIIKFKSLEIQYEIIDNIDFLTKEVEVDIFDSTLVPILELLIENTHSRTLIRTINEIVIKIDRDSTKIGLDELNYVKDQISQKTNLLSNLDIKAKSGSSHDLSELFAGEVYKMKNPAINSSILKNPNLFNFEKGLRFVEDLLLNTNSLRHKYYMQYFGDFYENIMLNQRIANYPKVKDIMYKHMCKEYVIYNILSNSYLHPFSNLFSNDNEYMNYVSAIFHIYNSRQDEESRNLADDIQEAFYLTSSNIVPAEKINTSKFSDEAKREIAKVASSS